MSNAATAEKTVKPAKHDWSRFDAVTPAQRKSSAASDPDAKPITAKNQARLKRTPQVKVVRRALGLSQEEFADRFRIPLGTLRDWEQGRMKAFDKKLGQNLFTGRRGPGMALTTRQYARLVSEWVVSIGLDPLLFGTHSLRRTKATLIYKRTGNLRAVQLLLGHTKIESTVRYLGIEGNDALEIAEQVDI